MEKMNILFSQEKKRKRTAGKQKKKKKSREHGGRRGRRGVLLLRRRVPERSMLSLSCSSEEMEGMRVPEKAALRFEPVSVEPDAKRDRVSGDRRGAAPPCASQKKKRKKLTFVDQTSDQKQSIQRRCRERVLLCPFEHGRAASGEIGWESGEMYSPSIGGYERDLPRPFFFFFFFLPSSTPDRERKKRARQRAAFYESLRSFLVPRLQEI